MALHVSKVRRQGAGSYTLTIPKDLAVAAGINFGDRVMLEQTDQGVTITKEQQWQRRQQTSENVSKR